MKTKIIASTLALICMVPAISQETEKKVQIKIIENGNVTTDTTFTVTGDVDKNDLNRVSKMLNKENVFVFRDMPGGKNFEYNFRYNGMPDEKFDSLMRRHHRFFGNDSVIEAFRHRFHDDSVMIKEFSDMRAMRFHRMPPFPRQRIIERQIIVDDDFENIDDSNVIIRKDRPGKKQIIIRDNDDDVKTIRKKIDDDTELIIIKKDKKNSKQDKNRDRKRDR